MSGAPERARTIGLLERLVAIDTQNPPGREAEAAALLADEMRALGLAVESREFAPGRVNVAGRLENGPGPVFAFNTHTDVVPAGEGWTTPPLRLAERDGRLYGRGACDAKGQIAAIMAAVRMLAERRRHWRGTVLAVFVADEETGSLGAKDYARGRPRIDYAVIGEPTSNAVVTAHKGSVRPLIRVTGKSAHTGTPDLGVNAIFKAAHLLRLIEAQHAEVRQRAHPLCGRASLTVPRIAGGVAENIVPDECEFSLDRRMVPGESEEAALAEIRALIERARAEAGVEAEIVGFRPTTGAPAETPAEAPIVKAALAAARAHGVAIDGVKGFMGACDMVHFAGVGASAVVLGPGDLAVAHKPDECVAIDELLTASLVYRDLALAMLAEAGARGRGAM